MNELDENAELHFRTGLKGSLARFILARRAAGDPFDATVVLPCLVFLLSAHLVDTGRLGPWIVSAGLAIAASFAGCWIGICLGPRGVGRAMLRGILVGAFEGAGVVAIVNETVGQAEALRNAFILMWINSFLFSFASYVVGTASDILTVKEIDYQKGAPRRALIHTVI